MKGGIEMSRIENRSSSEEGVREERNGKQVEEEETDEEQSSN